MPPTTHSSFSASSGARLLACPGSFGLGERLGPQGRTSTVFSAEGTLAHALGEVCIFTGRDASEFIGQTRHSDGFTFTIDEDFAEHVQTYVDFVRGLIALGYIVALERTVDPSVQWTEPGRPDNLPPLPLELFGTADVVAYHPGKSHLIIGDLKFGAGVSVEVERNAQLTYYGAGAMNPGLLADICNDHGQQYAGVAAVTFAVIQPRAHHPDGPVRTWDTTPSDVRNWARTTLYNGVLTAIADNGQTLAAGDWCRFCPILAHCAKPREMAAAAAKAMFLNTPLHNIPDPDGMGGQLPDVHLTDDQIADLLDRITIIEPWLKALKVLGQKRIRKGATLTGWKLVPGRGRRVYAEADEAALETALLNAGVKPADLFARKMKSPAQLERAVGKQEYAAKVAPHVVKKSSDSQLAAEGDPRARIERRKAKDAFAPQTATKPNHGE